MNHPIKNYIIGLYTLFALAFVGLAIIGGIHNFSSVPFDDMWGGYLNFFLQAAKGDFFVWFHSWNEHPIILSRVLFWVDIAWFKGLSIFLILINYLLIACSCLIFFAFLKEGLQKTQDYFLRTLLALFITIFLFSWLEKENLTWAFQSQFFLAQLLPLTAFYLLHKSYQATKYSTSLFALSAITGFFSLGTMANGVLTLPLLIMFALLLGMNKKRIVGLLLLTGVAATFFLLSGGHAEASEVLVQKLNFLKYLGAYIGGPFFYLSQGHLIISYLAAFFFISAFVFKLWQVLRWHRKSSWQLALLVFIGYLMCSALLVAIWRFKYQIVSERYMYPMLMGWSALLVLYAPFIARMLSKYPKTISIILVFFPLLLLPLQLHALNPKVEDQFEKKIAALALAMNVKDDEQIRLISQFPESLFAIANEAAVKNISIFGQAPYKDLKNRLGNKETLSKERCGGEIEQVTKINDAKYLAVQGWIFNENTKTVPKIIHILDKNQQIIGYAFTGKARAKDNEQVEFSGFKGYVLANEFKQQVILNAKQPDCSVFSSFKR